MTEQVGAVQPQVVTQKKDNAVRNTAIAGGTGLIAGGAAGYATKQIMKNNEFTDEFVKEAHNQILNTMFKDNDDTKLAKAIFNMDENPTIDAIKKFLKNNAKAIEEESGDMVEFLRTNSDEEIQNLYNGIRESFNTQVKSNLDDVTQTLKYYLEDGKKLFTKQECFKDNKLYKAALKAQHEVKGKAGLIWGAATGAVLGTGAFIASKMSGKKEA